MEVRKRGTKFKAEKGMLLPVLVFLVGIAILVTLGYHFQKNQDSLQQSKVELNAVTYAEHLRLDIMQGLGITETLERILVNNDGVINKFPQVAENMMDDCIQNIQLAPEGVVTEIYPEAGNEAGKIDLLHDKDRGESSRYGRDNDVITMQGPFTLKQGGSGIAVRNPVFLEREDGQREFWGFTIVIIRVPEIFAESIKALSDFGYDYRLSKTVAPWDDTYVEVYGSEAQMDRAVTYCFEAGDTGWRLEVQPKDGWSSGGNLHLMFGCGVLILLLLSGLITVLTLLRRTKASEGEMTELNRKLQETLDLANAASVAKTNFISNMSHDIRTPMNAIVGYTTIALGQNPEEKTRECLEKIRESSDHLLTLINDVLDISRIESGKLVITPVKTDIRKVVDDVLSIIRGFTVGRELNIEVRREPLSNPYVLADDIRIREVLVNVLSNAVKFTRDGGTVTFSADYLPGEDGKINVRYVISDTGIGMSPEFQKHIFEEFTQEHSDARTQYTGTGLGMTIAKKYVELMHGTISVQSKQGQGSTFAIELPLEQTDDAPKSEKAARTKGTQLSGHRVLLAEDNDLNAAIAQIFLENWGMSVQRVVNGAEAVKAFSEAPEGSFDVILMDIMMPVMNGLTAAKAIRALARPDAGTIPIIALTANAFSEDVQKCLDAGMNAHIAKPLDVNAMEETLKSVLDR